MKRFKSTVKAIKPATTSDKTFRLSNRYKDLKAYYEKPVLTNEIVKESSIPILKDSTDSTGLNRYEFDFYEQANEFIRLMTSLKQLKPMENNYTPTNLPLTLKKTSYYTYDFTVKPKQSDYTLHAQVSRLNLDKETKHAFLLLCGDRFNPYSGFVTLTGKDQVELNWQMNELLKSSLEIKDKVRNEPLNFIELKKPKQDLAFPNQWLNPSKEQ